MKYILKDGYIDEITFGATIECKNQTCTEYTGTIPTDYASLEAWAIGEAGKLNAWKIVEGNLVFDNAKYLELKELWEQQAEDNRPVYHKEIFEMKQQIEDISDISESQYQKAAATGKIITVDNVKKAYPKVKITDINPYSFSKVDLIATGKNLLKNEAVLQKIDGVNFTPNRDRSITIQGSTATTNKTATGTSVDIKGSSYDINNLEVKGRSTQEASPSPNYPSEIETVKGRNICDVSTSQIGVAWNLSTNSARAICNVRVMPSTTYSLSFENINGIDAMFFGEKVKNTDTGTIGGMTQITANRQITTKSTTNWLCIQFNKANISLNDIEAIKLQIEKGSAITNFVPFDNIQIINTGKNLWDLNSMIKGRINEKTGNIEYASYTTDLTINGDEFSFTVSQAWNSGVISDFIPVSIGNYMYSLTTDKIVNVYLDTYDKGHNRIGRVTLSPAYTTANVKAEIPISITNDDIKYIRIHFEVREVGTYVVKEVQLEKNSIVTSYEPCQSQTLNIDLKGNELCSIGDTKDILDISVTGDTEINKKIGKVVLDGSENWRIGTAPNQTNTTYFSCDSYDNIISAKTNKIMSYYFLYNNDLWLRDVEGIYFDIVNSNLIRIRISKDIVTTVEEFKTWLSTHNVTVIYELATPKTINLSPIEGLYLYEGTNCITNSENADMEVKYTISEKIEYNIAGTSSNTSAFLCFKKGINYYLSGLENQKIKMYYFDGTDRTEIYSGSGGAIKFTDSDKLVTQIVLITGGSSSKLTIYPMLVIGTAAAPYETYTSSMLSIDFKEYIEAGFFLGSNTFLGSNAFLKGTNINYILIEKNTIYVSVNNEEHKIGSGNVILFDGYDVLYTMQDTTLEVNYCINALEVDNLDFMRGKKTTTNKFKVLADGSIEAHDGNFSGTVTATAGKIGGCEISNGKLQVPSANISGTLSADKINGGTINASTISLEGVSLSPNASKLGGWSASSNRLYSNSSKVASSLYSNGNFILGGNYGMVKFDTNPVRITTADKLLISDSYSASEMANSNDTISIRAFSGTVHINSNYGVYAGSNRLDGSSSKAIKKNIKPIDPKYVDEIYKEVNKMPLYTYDYLDKYGDKDDFGFIIEDIENTCLNRTLKINKNPDDEKVKNYGTLELNKMNLLLIKELMKKNEELEKRIKELERKC